MRTPRGNSCTAVGPDRTVTCRQCGKVYTQEFKSRTLICSDACRQARGNEKSQRWRAAHPEKVVEMNRRWFQRNYDGWRDRRYARKYGLSTEAVKEMLEAQGQKCAICAQPVVFGGRGGNVAVVDHCHSGGHVRGMLCSPCNIMIGCAKDNPETLHAAIDYLRRATP